MAPASRRYQGDGPAPETTQRVFHFGKGRSDGNKAMKDLVRACVAVYVQITAWSQIDK